MDHAAQCSVLPPGCGACWSPLLIPPSHRQHFRKRNRKDTSFIVSTKASAGVRQCWCSGSDDRLRLQQSADCTQTTHSKTHSMSVDKHKWFWSSLKLEFLLFLFVFSWTCSRESAAGTMWRKESRQWKPLLHKPPSGITWKLSELAPSMLIFKNPKSCSQLHCRCSAPTLSLLSTERKKKTRLPLRPADGTRVYYFSSAGKITEGGGDVGGEWF